MAYIPPTSKSLSIKDIDDRDGLGNSSPPTATASDCMGPDPAFWRGSSNLISFKLSNTGSAHLIPPRAPGLNLQLPTATSPQSDKSPLSTSDPDSRARPRKNTFEGNLAEAPSAFADSRFSVDFSLPRHSVASLATSSGSRWSQPPPMPIPNSLSLPRHHYGSNDGIPPGSCLSLDLSSNHPSCLPNQTRPRSNVSDATTHDSHLSSILDPAMIVIPVTLVRTASGRQAAVQRVALRGQEKARVMQLNRNLALSTPALRPPLPPWTSHPTSAAQGNGIPGETPHSPSRSLILSGQSQFPRASTLPHLIDEDEPVKLGSMSTIVAINSEIPTPRDDSSQVSTKTAPCDPFTDLAAIEIIHTPNTNPLRLSRSACQLVQSSDRLSSRTKQTCAATR